MGANDKVEATSVKSPFPEWIIRIDAEDGSDLLAIRADGSVSGSIENAGEAAERFVASLRGMTEVIRAEAKAEALLDAADGLERGIPVALSTQVWLRARAEQYKEGIDGR